jgi:hypothetical protein
MWWRSKRSGWSLLGFIPVIRPLVAFASSVHVRKYRRLVARFCIAELFKSTIASTDGFFMDYVDESGTSAHILVHPRVPFNIADEPEMQASFIGSKIGAMSNMPCSVCEVVPKQDGIMSHGVLRDASIMRAIFPIDGANKILDKSVAKILTDQYSMHCEWNPCWWIPGYDPFSNPGCIIHQLDHGVFDVVLDLIIQLLKDCFPSGSVGDFDVRWAQLASFPGGKKFKRGVSTLANATCSEHRIMSMGLPFAVRGFSPSFRKPVSGLSSFDDVDTQPALPPHFLEDLAVTYLRWRWMLAKKRFTEEMRRAIDADGQRLWELIDQLHRFVHNDFPIELGTKLHKVCHWVRWITMFGAPENYSSEIWEGAHKLVKRWRSSMSWKTQGAASRKVMQSHSVYDAHATDPAHSSTPINSDSLTSLWASVDMNAPPGWLKCDKSGLTCDPARARRNRVGSGGFRGRSSIGRVFDMSLDTRRALCEFESLDDNRRMCLCDRILLYIGSVADCHREGFDQMIRLLSATFCQKKTGSVVVLVENECECDADGYPLFRFFMGGNSHRSDPYDFVRVWNKMFIDSLSEGAYAEVGSFVEYHNPRKNSHSGKMEIGRLTWMLSVLGKQVVTIQKMREVPVKGGPLRGESFTDQFFRQQSSSTGGRSSSTKASKNIQLDPLKRCFWMLQLLDDDTPANFDVLILPESPDDPFPIVSIVMLQPDFSSIVTGKRPYQRELPKRWFLVEYVLL